MRIRVTHIITKRWVSRIYKELLKNDTKSIKKWINYKTKIKNPIEKWAVISQKLYQIKKKINLFSRNILIETIMKYFTFNRLTRSLKVQLNQVWQESGSIRTFFSIRIHTKHEKVKIGTNVLKKLTVT